MAVMTRRAHLLLAAGLILFAGRAAAAQEKPDPASLPEAPAPKQDPNASGQTQSKKGMGNPLGLVARKSFFYPELATTPGPLSTKQKFQLFLTKSMSPPQILGSLATAGITQATNSYPGYGQGGEGFANRFGASMATGASSNFFGTFILASVLHEDPRYFPKLEGGFGSRMGYAVKRAFVTRRDRGGSGFDWSGTMGPLAAEGLANSYLPEAERTVGKTFERYGFRIGFGAANNVLKEYWPTIFKRLRIDKVAPGLGPEKN
jgi:hypothetical protein